MLHGIVKQIGQNANDGELPSKSLIRAEENFYPASVWAFFGDSVSLFSENLTELNKFGLKWPWTIWRSLSSKNSWFHISFGIFCRILVHAFELFWSLESSGVHHVCHIVGQRNLQLSSITEVSPGCLFNLFMELLKSFNALILKYALNVVNNREQNKVLLDVFPEINKSLGLTWIHLMKLCVKFTNVVD